MLVTLPYASYSPYAPYSSHSIYPHQKLKTNDYVPVSVSSSSKPAFSIQFSSPRHPALIPLRPTRTQKQHMRWQMTALPTAMFMMIIVVRTPLFCRISSNCGVLSLTSNSESCGRCCGQTLYALWTPARTCSRTFRFMTRLPALIIFDSFRNRSNLSTWVGRYRRS